MIQISFTFGDVADAKSFINGLDAESKAAVAEALGPQDATPPKDEAPASAKKPPGRPKKEAAATPPSSAPVVTPPQASPTVETAASPPAGPVVNTDTIRATAEAVVAKLGADVGMAKAREIIRRLGGCLTIRDIPLDKCAAVNAELLAL